MYIYAEVSFKTADGDIVTKRLNTEVDSGGDRDVEIKHIKSLLTDYINKNTITMQWKKCGNSSVWCKYI